MISIYHSLLYENHNTAKHFHGLTLVEFDAPAPSRVLDHSTDTISQSAAYKQTASTAQFLEPHVIEIVIY